ncbi:MAG: STAS domain-containing protein [Deltaproteobacteria bacterium]|jgi:anti-anti-sigma factor|nr:STAS domain-containing protein [Deltaproteobacteria bacterium]
MKTMRITEHNASCLLVEGRMDATSISIFDTEIKDILAHPEDLVLDLEKVDYISSAGLRSILTLAKNLNSAGKSLVITTLTSTVYEVFKIAGFLDILKVFASRAEGITALQDPERQ